MADIDPLKTEDFQKCVDFHGHICPGLVTGYRASKAGLDWLKENRAEDEEVVAIVETDACSADAVQVLTGCTFGKGNFVYRDYGKMAFTFFSRKSGKGVRIVSKPHGLKPGSRHQELMGKIRKDEASPAEREEFRELHLNRAREVFQVPLEILFDVKEVYVPLPEKARVESSKPCAQCGESTMPSKMTDREGRLLCRACINKE